MATRYHRLARETPAYAWWRLPAAGLLALVLYFMAIIVLVAIALAIYAVRSGSDGLEDWLSAAGELNLQRLDHFALDMLSLVALIPALLLAVFIAGARPIGYLSSVTGRLRWGWLGRTAVMSFVVFIVTIGAALAVTEATDPGDVEAPSNIGLRVLLTIGLILLLTPFQAAAEEYVFRGYVLQLVGSWTRFAAIPVIVSVPLFVVGHTYDLWGLVDVGIFGLTAAVLTIRTGGLEAAIAAHTANNVVLFVLDALGMISATDDSGAGPVDLVPTAVSSVVLLLWVEWAARRRGLARTRDPIPVPPPAAPVPIQWAPPPAYTPPPAQWSQWAPQPPAPAPAPAVHPNAPDYPGELPSGWEARDPV
ncbi:type II CAAX endopeptidase family protein [Aeromicrobium sp.]|uniref:CPBP family intramembrane glutamic endopeptidase n=1 Tax=Aeromicrobium sp. TaxID=1871063 RepID=UPI0030BDAA9F